jgi:hypothetical protein
MGLRPDGSVLLKSKPDEPAGPDNCYWGSPCAIPNGRPVERRLCLSGRTRTVREWSDALGIPVGTIYTRLYRGASAEQALSLNGDRA